METLILRGGKQVVLSEEEFDFMLQLLADSPALGTEKELKFFQKLEYLR